MVLYSWLYCSVSDPVTFPKNKQSVIVSEQQLIASMFIGQDINRATNSYNLTEVNFNAASQHL